MTVISATPEELFYDSLARAQRFAERMDAVRPWGSWALLAMCSLVFVLEYLMGGAHGSTFLRLGAVTAPLVLSGEWWRLVGATFLHLGVLHFAVNTYSLYAIGPPIEKMYGTLRFLVIYGAAGVGSSMVAVWHPMGLAAGASGALFGIVGAALCLGFLYRNQLPEHFGKRLRKIMVLVVVGNLGLGFGVNAALSAFHSSTAIGNGIHVAGLVIGMIVAALLRPTAVDGEKPLAPTVWLVLAMLGVAPFVVETGVVAHAIYSATVPSQTYHDPAGRFTFDYPSDLTAVRDANVDHLVGEDYEMVVPTISRGVDRRATVRRMQLSKLHVLAVYERTMAGRVWSVLNVHDAESGVDAVVAVTDTPAGAVQIDSAVDGDSPMGDAQQALDGAMQSFRL